MIRPDERAVMTYLSCFYHAFQGLHQVNNNNDIMICELSLYYRMFESCLSPDNRLALHEIVS